MGQHFVPRTHIRRFTGNDDMVAEMLVPSLQINLRRRSPSKVFARNNYYDDEAGGIDHTFNDIETRIGRMWDKLLNAERIQDAFADQAVAMSFLVWVASSLSRGPDAVGHLPLIQSTAVELGIVDADTARVAERIPRLFANSVRQLLQKQWFDMLSGAKWRWRRTRYTEELILTDNSIFRSTWAPSGRAMVLVPVSSGVLIVGVHEEDIGGLQFASAAAYNAVAIRHAEERVVAASSSTLESLRNYLNEHDGGSEGLAAEYAARKTRIEEGLRRLGSRSAINKNANRVRGEFQ